MIKYSIKVTDLFFIIKVIMLNQGCDYRREQSGFVLWKVEE